MNGWVPGWRESLYRLRPACSCQCCPCVPACWKIRETVYGLLIYWISKFYCNVGRCRMSFHPFAMCFSSHSWVCSCKSLGFLLQVHSIEMLEHRWRVTAVVYAFIVVVAQRTLKCCLDHSNSPTNQEAGFTCGSVWDFGPFSLEVAGLFWLNYINAINMNGMKKLDLQSWASEACLIDWVHCEKTHET